MSSDQPVSNGQHSRPEGRHWFYLLPQDTESARLLYAARLTDKAWHQGDRVCLVCNPGEQMDALDTMLWQFSPESFLPHRQLASSTEACPERIGLLAGDPAPEDWETVIVLGKTLPASADRFRRLALIANNDPQTLNQARGHFRQLRELGIEARVHDARRGAQSG